MFQRFAETADRIGATTKKLEKEQILGDYLGSLSDEDLRIVPVWFAARPFPLWEERVLGVGSSTMFEAASKVTGIPRDEIATRSRRLGDIGDGLAEAFAGRALGGTAIAEIATAFAGIAELSGRNETVDAVTEMFAKLGPDEVRYVAKIMSAELRIGLREGLVLGAIAKAFGRKLRDVRRANMLQSDLGRVAVLARHDRLSEAAIELFHPIGMMLAAAEEDPEKLLATVGENAIADDKYDGIRAQMHVSGGEVRIYSRSLDPVTARFPEIVEAAIDLGRDVILDGEIVGWKDYVLPFATLQPRIGRRKLTPALIEEVPVRYLVFDLIYADGDALLDLPLEERLERLEDVVQPLDDRISLGFQRRVSTVDELEAAFDEARARGNEGLVLKAPGSTYEPGRRGRTWLKYKKALATLDCVVTAAEYGHGKRRDVLSDLTFAVWRDGELVNIGKAYSGLTDVEIAMLTEKFEGSTTGRYGPVRTVEPEVVLEIAFDRIQESKRHKSGFAMRFPRIVRIRDDKRPDQASTIDEVRAIYEGQLAREAVDG